MSKEIYISSTPHETRLAIVEDDALTEIYYERENEYTLAGSIYNGRVTRVLPGMQSSFVDVGLERDAFLYITDFMEEAPDSAEFDTSSNGEHAPRAPRVLEGARTEEAAVRPESNGRDADRGERGGRARRGDRDRNPDRNRDRPVNTASPSPFAMPTAGEQGRIDAPRSPADELPLAQFTSGDEDAEIGEGAPGADGSRRWRGRRGRRRGRGTTGQPASDSTSSAPADGDSSAYDEVLFEGGSTYEIDGATEVKAPVAAIPAINAPRDPNRSQEGQRGGRRDKRDNARRDEPRTDTPRQDSEGRPSQRPSQRPEQRPDQSAQRVPRGFAPSRELYGVDSGEVAAPGPVSGAYDTADSAAEPIILPGESLSKYRKGGDEAASLKPANDSTPMTLAAPSSLYTIAAGWDGGATLPGETLSRHRPSDSRPEARADFPARGETRQPRRDSRPGNSARGSARRDGRQDFRNPDPGDASPRQDFAPTAAAARVIEDLDGPSIAETPEEQPEVARVGHPEQFATDEILHEPAEAAQSADSKVQSEPASSPEPLAAHVPAAESDYEPGEASASYRVDPLTRSEYRQSAPTLEPPTEVVEVSEPDLNDAAPESAHQSIAHTITPAPDEPLAKIHPDPELHAKPAEPTIEAHDITSISAEGEMFSESVEPPAEAAQPVPMEAHSPASPIQHEGAVIASGGFDSALSSPVPSSYVQARSSGFSPGAGELAEEELDDEDFTASSIHASSIEEMDYAEEETLEGTADLGTMLREMSIDHLTRTPSPEIDDDLEDDLEEDELDEDDLEEEEQEESEQNDESIAGEEDREGNEIDDNPNLDMSEESLRSGSPADAEFFEAQFGQPSEANRSETGREQPSGAATPQRGSSRDTERRGGRRDGRRDARRGRSDRDRGADRPRSTGGSGDRERSGGSSRGRHSVQSTDLPAISDLLKPGQEILVQIAKEPIAKKGARITSHIALPGRFLVFMPTVHHTGVSRKIESDAERRRLKEILLSEKGEAAGGFIVRTAASGASEEELRSDLRFLLNLWADIKARSESSKSPALIYHDLNLIERILRDQVTDNFSAIWVDSESEYERVLRFLQRFQPTLIRRVKLYTKETPLFEQFGITDEINKALRSKVWLKSGGSIVINQTEALVAIDINTGKFVGKTARLEDTIVKTNLDAIPEIVRQIRLRDLGGIIIIDFIDMDERKNRNRVMAALEEELKADRAPSKVLQFNDFGLVAITRKRVKQSLERTLSTTCNVCVGTGMVKSPITVCNDIYVEMKKMHKHFDRGDVMLRVHPEVVKQLKTSGSKWLQEMEEMCGKTILVKSDPSLHPEQFDIH